MVAITTAFNASANSPGFTVNLTGLTGGTKYTITRIDVGARYEDTFVRGQYNAPVMASTASFTDYECPIDRMTQYKVDLYSGVTLIGTATSTAAKVDPTNVVFPAGYNNFWIKNISDPTKSLAVMIGQVNEFGYDAAILGEYRVLGRKAPVVYTDVWGSRRGDFPVYSLDYLGIQTPPLALERLLTSGDPLLFQSAIQDAVVGDMYFVVTSIGRTQSGSLTDSWLPTLTYSVDYTEIDMPPVTGSPLGNGLVGDLTDDPAAFAATWNGVTGAFGSWSDLLRNYL